MKLLAAHIYGFGKWKDFRVEFPEENLFLISGANESGKSTIRQFMLFVLFGLPPKQREFYRPKTGGEIGGRLKIRTDEMGPFYIERTHEKQNGEAVCYFPDGSVKGNDWWNEQLRGMNRSSFQSVFSFDAEDLIQLHAIKSDELGELLLGTGMTGTDKIYSMEKMLDSELDKRFKPQGKNPEINGQLNKLTNLQQQWNQLQEQEETYQQQKKAEAELGNKIEAIQEDLENVKTAKAKQGKLVQALPILYMLAGEKGKWRQLPPTSHFPENGLERYASLNEKLLPLRSRLGLLESDEKDYRQEISARERQLWPEEKWRKAESLAVASEAYQQKSNQIDYLDKRRKEAAAELDQQVKDLHLPFNWEQLGSLSLPFHLEDSWHQIKEAEQQVKAEWDGVEREERSTQEQLRALQEEQARAAAGILEESKAAELQKIVDEKRTQNHAKTEKSAQELKTQSVKWRKRQKWTLFGGLAAVAAMFGIVAFLSDIKSFYSVGILLLITGLMQILRTNKSSEQLVSPDQEQETLAAHWTVADFQEAEQQLRRHYQLLDEQQSITRQMKQCSLELLKLSERKRFIEEKQQQTERQIKEQESEYPFLADVDIAYWPKLYHKLLACMEKYHSLMRLHEEKEELAQELNGYKSAITAFLKENELLAPNKTKDYMQQLNEIMEEQKQIRQSLLQYQEWLEKTIGEKQRLLEEMQPYEQDIETLFQTADVKNEEEFLRLGRQQQEARSIQSKIDSYRSQLAPLLTEEETSHYLADLPDQAEAEQILAQFDTKLEDLESRLEAARQELADIRSMINSMEKSEQYSQVKHEYYGEIEQLKKQVKQWAVYQTAKEMLAETKQSYQQNYLPQTLKAASEYFRELTDGRYVDIFPPEGTRPFSVADREGFRYAAGELSKGTADQLYISIRLALSSMYQAEKMPLFIDDAFVHFDPKRKGKFGSILLDLADRQQVMLFSSSQSISKSLDEIPVIDLENREVIELA
ncbi:AAA family ATPase [Virgibacillus senegalensis]|uniref:AAA family ATPase n=1 Tax=Virgibacillus senegalensis TaxID=1499679 RepID=UPI00069D68AB|nr:AAA family ATPase [Virgibacillus senegalensis]